MILGDCEHSATQQQRSHRFGRLGAIGLCVVSLAWSGAALGKDDDDAKAAATLPNIYLDLTTTYARIPANTLAFGFSPTLPLQALSNLSSPAVQGLAFNAPLTVDINDRLTVYGGLHGSATRPDGGSWTSFGVDSWNVGFQADVFEQNGGMFPTVTLQSTLSKSTSDSPFASTTIDSTIEFNYALNEDETSGLLAGARYTSVSLNSNFGRVDSPVIGYLGGYYQWPNNWKASVRAGIQSFGGAHIGALTPIKPFTQPILRVDLDRMDDNDNRLFGISAEVAWTPSPSYLLVLRTPLFLVGP
jgi:hypothetical protein